MAGGDENGPKDMGAVLNAVRYIRQQTGAASMVVHHPGWTGEHGRGHSSQFGAVDTDIFIANNVMTVKKLRDGESGQEIAFQRKVTTVGFDKDGDRITSCYVEVGRREEMQIPPTGAEAAILEVARALAAEGKPITVAGIRELAAENRTFLELSGSLEEDAIRKHLERADKKHLVRRVKRGRWVIVEPDKPDKTG
jgi:hypothetical protein